MLESDHLTTLHLSSDDQLILNKENFLNKVKLWLCSESFDSKAWGLQQPIWKVDHLKERYHNNLIINLSLTKKTFWTKNRSGQSIGVFSSLFERVITWRQLHRRIQLRQKTRLVNLSFLPNIPSVGGAFIYLICLTKMQFFCFLCVNNGLSIF